MKVGLPQERSLSCSASRADHTTGKRAGVRVKSWSRSKGSELGDWNERHAETTEKAEVQALSVPRAPRQSLGREAGIQEQESCQSAVVLVARVGNP